MDISNSSNFNTIKNSINSFDIQTTKGNLHVFEVTKNTKNYDKVVKQADLFAYKNIETTTKKNFISKLKNCIKILKSPSKPLSEDTTILVAKNDRGKICASLFANPTDISKKVLEVSNVAVDKKYRHNNVFQKMYNSLECTVKKSGKFDVISLDAVNSAVPVYKKMGFKEATNVLANSSTHTPMKKYLKDCVESITLVSKDLLKKIK
ncbi:MAG: GNAT family N-acetyltransferase [bacterium]|nr:GNAT family N-acetyltransferase [bacterium]